MRALIESIVLVALFYFIANREINHIKEVTGLSNKITKLESSRDKETKIITIKERMIDTKLVIKKVTGECRITLGSK